MTKPIGSDTTAGTPSAPAHHRDANGGESLTCAELISAGVRTELLVSMALRRATDGGVAKSGDHHFRWGYPTPSWLAGVFEQLTRTGLLTLAEQDSAGLQRVSLTPAGHLRNQQLHTLPRRLPNPAPFAPGPGAPASPPDPGAHARRESCGSVLIPVTGARYVCTLASGHTSGFCPTTCTDADRTLRWWWCDTQNTHPPHQQGEC